MQDRQYTIDKVSKTLAIQLSKELEQKINKLLKEYQSKLYHNPKYLSFSVHPSEYLTECQILINHHITKVNLED